MKPTHRQIVAVNRHGENVTGRLVDDTETVASSGDDVGDEERNLLDSLVSKEWAIRKRRNIDLWSTVEPSDAVESSTKRSISIIIRHI